MSKKYQEKLVLFMDVIIGILITAIVIVSLYQNRNIFQNENSFESPKYYYVTFYDYRESNKEDETEVSKIATISVQENSSLELALKSLEYNCPIAQSICADPRVLQNLSRSGIYYYNDHVKEEIANENKELQKYWQCVKKAKSNKQKNKCQFNYHFNDNIEEDKLDIYKEIAENIDVLIRRLSE